MPPLGQTSDELRVLAWCKVEGDRVREGDPLLEIETDKATLEVEASVSGTLLRILRGAGESVTAGTLLGWLGEPGEHVVETDEPAMTPAAPAAASPAPSADLPAAPHRPAASADRVLATPAARMRARDLGVDIGRISGSGPDGRIERRDVEAAAGDGG
jgi:pyruvate/2-oxoglutarate dehydrogenase complex dihydrolipoamide acyltransferase (E2) component